MASYKPRVIDLTISNRLRNKGAILVEGAKWCGKTTTCEQHASSILYMSDPDRVKQNLQLADISPRSLLQGETPRLIDEWQMAPKLWDAVRFEVDHRDGFGHFLLTGSAVPAEMEQVHHTGTGRFAWIKTGRISDSEFYAWSEQAREQKKRCDEGSITAEDFQRWLKES